MALSVTEAAGIEAVSRMVLRLFKGVAAGSGVDTPALGVDVAGTSCAITLKNKTKESKNEIMDCRGGMAA